MNRFVKGLSLATLLLNTGMVFANTASNDDTSPYIGADYYQPWMKGSRDWNNIFPTTFPGFSFYLGTKFHPNFGLEVGYDGSVNKKKEWSLPAGTAFFGQTVGTSIAGTTKIRRSGGHFDVLMYLPIVETLEFMGSIGFGWLQPKIKTTFSAAPGASSLSSALASVSGEGRGLLRIGLGLSYMATDMVGFRAKVGWESTSTLRVKGNQAFADAGLIPKAFKGSTAMSVGAFVKF